MGHGGNVSDMFDRTVVWGGPRPAGIVTLCGSTRFKDVYDTENARLTLAGYVVISCGVWVRSYPPYDDVTEEQKRNLDITHKRKIDMSDRIHVINVDGYIGDSTRSEIEYAAKYGKIITYLETPA